MFLLSLISPISNSLLLHDGVTSNGGVIGSLERRVVASQLKLRSAAASQLFSHGLQKICHPCFLPPFQYKLVQYKPCAHVELSSQQGGEGAECCRLLLAKLARPQCLQQFIV